MSEKFIAKVKDKFGDYFKGYGIKKSRINIIIDDSDIRFMAKSEVKKNTQKALNELKGSEKIIPKAVLASEINEKNFFEIIGDSCEIADVASATAYIKAKLPKGFWEAYEALENEFKLDDLKKKLKGFNESEFHMNTFQNWLKFLKKAKFIELKNKKYSKIKLRKEN